MSSIKALGAGIASVVLVAIVANVLYMALFHLFAPVTPHELIQWGPGVWLTVRRSPAFWLAAILAFGLSFRRMYLRERRASQSAERDL